MSKAPEGRHMSVKRPLIWQRDLRQALQNSGRSVGWGIYVAPPGLSMALPFPGGSRHRLNYAAPTGAMACRARNKIGISSNGRSRHKVEQVRSHLAGGDRRGRRRKRTKAESSRAMRVERASSHLHPHPALAVTARQAGPTPPRRSVRRREARSAGGSADRTGCARAKCAETDRSWPRCRPGCTRA